MNPFKTHGAFSWQELLATDIPSALNYYTQLLGLITSEMPMPDGTYTLLHSHSKRVAGLMACPPDAPPCWTYYVTVHDIQKLLEENELNLIVPLQEVPMIGSFAGLLDPHGAYLSVIQYNEAGEPDKEAIVSNQEALTTHGAFSWFELHTNEPKAAADWYSKLFGWSIKKIELPSTYYIISVNGTEIGGIMEVMDPNVPPHWSCIVTVDNVDAIQSTVAELGGTVLAPAFDLPNVGRLLYTLDPTGLPLAFGTWAPQPSEE
ncbi:MAG: VOC family protein [Bacteroidota bacterium]|nr:VOC family protein [Bacteroidota bacterium]MDE2646058.1 VOC family protein [Bacteroidota bacterium]MXZ18996.1 VOC family protein [Rhodothermaceae bacterium]MYG69430.1 VOC family protein [Rhodothermaceae bacterium]MYJ45551.1 VOC family protein [Rhodothermaceae bacterium]